MTRLSGMSISKNIPGDKRVPWFEILVAQTKTLGLFKFKLRES